MYYESFKQKEIKEEFSKEAVEKTGCEPIWFNVNSGEIVVGGVDFGKGDSFNVIF